MRIEINTVWKHSQKDLKHTEYIPLMFVFHVISLHDIQVLFTFSVFFPFPHVNLLIFFMWIEIMSMSAL